MIYVSQDGTKNFTTVQAALDFVARHEEEHEIYIYNGIYKEQLTITTPGITLTGEDAEHTILTYDLAAKEILEDGMKRGTFRTYSCLVDTHDFTARNLTFENSAGPGSVAGQALALYVDGDQISFEDCRFLGNQDTLFTGPLPPKEIEKNGFIGPKQYAPRINGRHYYKNCYIEGDIDFIFGSATAYFEDCEFFCKDTGREINSYVTAASTPEGQHYGYVMNRCRFTSNCPPASCYLGRPWRSFAQVVLLNCEIGPHIHPEGWHDWNKPDAHATAYFAEYACTGPGACTDQRPDWVHILTAAEAANFTKERVLSTQP